MIQLKKARLFLRLPYSDRPYVPRSVVSLARYELHPPYLID
uniref:Uncharacterized protein n=1 Tax=Utricularia reniformis TaxID=192314 RepID=A0A1Y0B1X2_9LAMI|nr:hypothetical protein AEK19_MT1171 [Utricularia reniformis]ART31384.1 hypothetical protein AEK19_MT1171 [Utricularia reniformis]